MKIVSAVAMALFAAGALARSAGAQAPDCEAARCAVQEAVNATCPCDGASNHGRHMSCVARVVNQLAKDGLVPTNCKGKLKRCAARSTCGKPDFVTCQYTLTGTCDTTTGTCSEGTSATDTCTTDAECVTGTRCSIKSSEEACVARGGVPGTGSCCAACSAPTP